MQNSLTKAKHAISMAHSMMALIVNRPWNPFFVECETVFAWSIVPHMQVLLLPHENL